MIFGIDGGYVRSWHDKNANFEMIAGKSFSKNSATKRFGFVQKIYAAATICKRFGPVPVADNRGRLDTQVGVQFLVEILAQRFAQCSFERMLGMKCLLMQDIPLPHRKAADPQAHVIEATERVANDQVEQGDRQLQKTESPGKFTG